MSPLQLLGSGVGETGECGAGAGRALQLVGAVRRMAYAAYSAAREGRHRGGRLQWRQERGCGGQQQRRRAIPRGCRGAPAGRWSGAFRECVGSSGGSGERRGGRAAAVVRWELGSGSGRLGKFFFFSTLRMSGYQHQWSVERPLWGVKSLGP